VSKPTEPAAKNQGRLMPVFKNTLFGAANVLLSLVLNFISRKLFLNYIGIEFLSVNQVIASILTVLTFSEAGLNSAIVYMLYKPFARNDTEEVNRILRLYRKVNRIIAALIMGVGLLLIPMLPLFININIPASSIVLIYVMYLFNASFSYILSYRTVLFSSDQKAYIPSMISTFVSLARLILQCGVIYITHNYFWYLGVTILLNFLNYVIQYFIAQKYYPYVTEKSVKPSTPEQKTALKNNVISMFSINLSNIIITNTDNILISAISTIMVGYCANYISITSALESMMNNMYQALMHALGNYGVNSSAEQKHTMFNHIRFINNTLASFTTVCVAILADDFVVLVFGQQYSIPLILFISIILKYYWKLTNSIIWMYRDAGGLFRKAQKVLLIDAALNILLSVVLGQWIGVSGVYFATVVADIFTNFYFNSKLIYKELFKTSDNREYIFNQIIDLVETALIILIVYLATVRVPVTIKGFIMKLLMCIVIYCAIFVLRNQGNDEYKYSKNMVMKRLNGHLKKFNHNWSRD
jgi:O-antigen/teichoic acid export membrane protein